MVCLGFSNPANYINCAVVLAAQPAPVRKRVQRDLAASRAPISLRTSGLVPVNSYTALIGPFAVAVLLRRKREALRGTGGR